MKGLLISELRKIRTTRLWWIMLLCIFVLGAGYALLPAFISLLSAGDAPKSVVFSDPGTLISIYNGGNTLSRILALVVGIMSMGGEYRHKTLATTYLATPKRLKVVAAKALALAGYGLGYGLASVVAGILVAIPFVLRYDGSFQLTDGDVLRSIVLGIVSIALWVLIGMGVGILIRNMIVAMLVGVGFAYIVEPTVSFIFLFQGWNVPLNLMPTGATNAMLGVTSPILAASPDPFAWWLGALILLGWAAVPAAVGVLATVRKDVL